MKGRITAFAALANAALLLAVIAVFAFLPAGPVWSGHTLAFVILAGPVPLATIAAALGLMRHPATLNMRWFVRIGSVSLVISAAIMCGAALMALDTIRRLDTSTWAFLVPFLALFPIFILGGLGALCVGAARLAVSDETNWLAILGLVAAVAGIFIAGGGVPILIAAIALVFWWALLGAMLFLYKAPQGIPS